MNARKRKKAARVFIWRVLCLTDMVNPGSPGADYCLHDSGYECRAQDRRERRVLGAVHDLRPSDRRLVRAALLQNDPPPLWMGNGRRHHQRYRNRRKRQR